MSQYRLPDWAGGQTFTGADSDDQPDHVLLDIPGVGARWFARELLTPVDSNVLDEPGIGEIVIDATGDAWHHKDTHWWFGSRMATWDELTEKYGPLTLHGRPASPPYPGQAVDSLPIRRDLVCDLPAEFRDASGRCRLRIGTARFPGQVKLQRVEGDLFSRAVILDKEEAAGLAWTLLAAVSSS